MSHDDRHQPTDDPNGDDMSTRTSDQDLEALLRGALGARARAVVPDERQPPVIDWGAAPRTRRPWVAPLAVAASIAVVAGGIGLAVQPRPTTTATPPATQTTAPTPSTATSTASPTTSVTTPSTAPATSGTSGASSPPARPTTPATRSSAPPSSAPVVAPPAPPAPRVVDAAGARLVAPAGYTIRADRSGTVPAAYGQRWCFDTTGTSDCAFVFVALPVSSTQPLDGDVPGDVGSLRSLCGAASSTKLTLLDFRYDAFGLRLAQYRQWRSQCSDGASYDVAQWSVLTNRPYDLVTRVATPAVRAAMSQVVKTATLPERSSTTLLADSGVVRAVRPGTGGASVITLERVVIGLARTEPSTSTYVLPASVIVFDSTQGRSLTPAELVGKQVKIHTLGGSITFGDLVDAAGNPV